MNLLHNKAFGCCGALKYPKDKWRLMYALNPEGTIREMNRSCSPICISPCGRWEIKRIHHIKKMSGITPRDKNVESLKDMLYRIRNMSVAEYNDLYDSIKE
jgi:hypothetical protein